MDRGVRIDPAFNPVIEEIVSEVIEELERKTTDPPQAFITRDWLKKTKASLDEAIDVVFKPLADLHPEVQRTLRQIVQSIVRESWELTAKQLQPKAWVEKWWVAETDEDRRRIYYWALKNHCRLTPQHQRELLALLIQEVGYAQEQSKIKLTLRPLPDLGWQIDGEKVSFDQRLDWLPG